MPNIFCTNKLKSYLKPILSNDLYLASKDDWNATIFILDRKKCICFLNKSTIYAAVLFDFKVKDLPNLNKLFVETCIKQLISDKILKPNQEEVVRKSLEPVYFRSTDNDR